jgi:hypothetical protein
MKRKSAKKSQKNKSAALKDVSEGMDIREIDITKINPAPYNPRKQLKEGDLEYEDIKKSLDTFGLVEPLVWNSKTGNLVSGHQRYSVLKTAGRKRVWVSVVALDIAKEKALNVALNKIGGTWDYEKLQDLFAELKEQNFDLTLTGFDPMEIEHLSVADFNPPAVNPEDNSSITNSMVTISVTEEQAGTIKRAIQDVKQDSHYSAYNMSDGRALELICADYLSGI